MTASEEGMTVEIYSSETEQSFVPNESQPYPVASFVATSEKEIWMQIAVEGVLLRVRIEDVEKAIAYSKEAVRSESRFEEALSNNENT